MEYTETFDDEAGEPHQTALLTGDTKNYCTVKKLNRNNIDDFKNQFRSHYLPTCPKQFSLRFQTEFTSAAVEIPQPSQVAPSARGNHSILVTQSLLLEASVVEDVSMCAKYRTSLYLIPFVLTGFALIIWMVMHDTGTRTQNLQIEVNEFDPTKTKNMLFVVGTIDTNGRIKDWDLSTKECTIDYGGLSTTADAVHHLFWSGPIAASIVIKKMTTSPEIRGVYLDYSDCGGNFERAVNKYYKFITSISLKELTFVNFPENLTLICDIVQDVEIEDLQVLRVENVTLVRRTKGCLQSLISQNRHFLQSLSLPLSLLSSWFQTDAGVVLPLATDLTVNAENSEDISTELSLNSNFCSLFPSIERLNLTKGAIQLADIHKLFKCKQIQELVITVKVPNFIRSLKPPELLRNAPTSLTHAHITFIFDISSKHGCEVIQSTPSFRMNLHITTIC